MTTTKNARDTSIAAVIAATAEASGPLSTDYRDHSNIYVWDVFMQNYRRCRRRYTGKSTWEGKFERRYDESQLEVLDGMEDGDQFKYFKAQKARCERRFEKYFRNSIVAIR